MKRSSPMRRKTPLSQGAPLKRAPMKRAPKRRPAKAANDERWRSPEYLAWVRTLPCSVCGATQGVIAHHLIGMWGVSGMGLKAPDSLAMPACDGPGDTCHREIHSDKTIRCRQPDFLRDTISRAVRVFEGETKVELLRAWEFIEERETWN